MVKNIIFDLGGVYFTEGVKVAIPRFAKKYGISESTVESGLRGASAEIARQYRRGLITEAEFWRETKEKWGIQASDTELSELWASS